MTSTKQYPGIPVAPRQLSAKKKHPAYAHLSDEQIEAFGAEMEAIRSKHVADLGERDTSYIRKIIKIQRSMEVAGRGMLQFGFLPPLWAAGAASLGVAKILDNMEIGHNIMHGQYDWTNDPKLQGNTFEWDHSSASEHWRRSHNYEHHTWTNVMGKDRDVGYAVLRMSEDQRWTPVFLLNPVYATLLALNFDWGIALHELETEKLMSGEIKLADKQEVLKEIGQKWGKQSLKDFVFFPALAGPGFLHVLTGNIAANVIRNVWTFGIIFCGHFPDGVELFTEDEVENETRSFWYLRQLLGSANITGGELLHVMSGNLTHQIEHHLFPDVPAHRYAEMSVEVQDACERYGLPYNKGGFTKQFGSVVRRICKLALPNRN